MVCVKICGVTTLEDALMVAEAGADMIGLNFYRPSPRYITPQAARAICATLRDQLGYDCPLLVGVFANALVAEVVQISDEAGLDCVQLSGDEPASLLDTVGPAYKAIRPVDKTQAQELAAEFAGRGPDDERLPSLLLDAYHPALYGGTGETASREVVLALRNSVPRLMLAGGLTPDNVGERVASLCPWGVDVASGVEAGQPGIKDRARVRAFIEQARTAAGKTEAAGGREKRL